MGGALPAEELRSIIAGSGFTRFVVRQDEVTDEYALKWGYGLGIKAYIGKAFIFLSKN